jgi:hypothetical protein
MRVNETPARQLSSRVRRTTAFALVSIVIGLLTAEASLQIAALFIQGESRVVASMVGRGTLRVLCMGDSNTWGLYVERGEA